MIRSSHDSPDCTLFTTVIPLILILLNSAQQQPEMSISLNSLPLPAEGRKQSFKDKAKS